MKTSIIIVVGFAALAISASSAIEIPSPNSLVMQSDPIVLGRKIANLAEDERDEPIQRMKQLIEENEDTMQADFYKAAIKAIESPARASREWKKVMKIANDYGKDMTEGFPGVDNLFVDDTPLATVSRILNIDPINEAFRSRFGIRIYMYRNTSGSLVVNSPFLLIRINKQVQDSIRKLIMDRIEERGGIENYYREFFISRGKGKR